MNVIKLEGLPVNKAYYDGQQPAISNGMFRIEHISGKKICLEKIQVKILINSEEIQVPEFYIYKLPDYEEISKQDFCIDPLETITVDISFPFVYKHTNPWNDIKVAMSCLADGQQYTGLSGVEITLRHI